MLKWLVTYVVKTKDWCIAKSPPWVGKFEKGYPKSFWTLFLILWLIPAGLTLAGILIAGLALIDRLLMALVWLWSIAK